MNAMRRRLGAAACAFALVVASGRGAEADVVTPDGARLVGGDAGVLLAEGERTLWAGFRFSILRPRRMGLEVGLGTLPQATTEYGVVALVPEIDAAWAMPVGPSACFVARAGVSAIASVASGFAAARPGLNFGGSLLFASSPRLGWRIDYTARTFGAGPPVSTLTIGVFTSRR